MSSWLKSVFSVFGSKPAVIRGAGKLEEGYAKKVVFGDPLAGQGVEVILCRVEGQLKALDAQCPHEDGQIIEGPLHEGKYAVCPLHNFWFDPANGEVVNSACKRAKTYKVRESDGDCEIWL